MRNRKGNMKSVTQRNQPNEEEVTWGNLQDKAQSREDICATIASWSAGTPRPFAGMPRPTEPDYRERMRKAYDDTMQDLATVAAAPQTPTANIILGRMGVHATGFASCLRIDGEEFNPHAGPKHLLAALPAIVAGRYRQIRDCEEGERGMRELAAAEAKFRKTGVRMTLEELELCRDHKLEVLERSPDNPVDPRLFTKVEWETMQKARPQVAETVTQCSHGQLSLDPKVAHEQLNKFAREMVRRGWHKQGKHSCRILWGMLTDEHRAVLRFTSCYYALSNESFANEDEIQAPSGFSGLVTAIRAHFGGPDDDREAGANLTRNYRQKPMETLRAFVMRVKRYFSRDLGPEWDAWPHVQRRNLINRVLIKPRMSHHPRAALYPISGRGRGVSM